MHIGMHYRVAKYLTYTFSSIGLVLNLLTLLVLHRTRQKGFGPYIVLLKSLTSADLLASLHLLLHKALRDDHFTCGYTAIFYPCSPVYVATYLTLVLIAINLYLAIVHPYRHLELVTTRRTVLAVVLCWSFAVLVYSIDVFRALYDHMTGKHDFCRALETYKSGFFVDPVKYLYMFEWSWAVFMALVYTGLVYMTVMYVKIYLEAEKSLSSSRELSAGDAGARQEKRHSIYTSLLLLVSFLAVYLPFCVAYTSFQVTSHLDYDSIDDIHIVTSNYWLYTVNLVSLF